MSGFSGNPSVPPYRRKPIRALSESERAAFHAVADTLIPPNDPLPSPSELTGFDRWLDRALAARGDDLDVAAAAAESFADTPADGRYRALKEFSEADPDGFQVLSSVVAGAYLMVPAVRERIGYPGQRRHPPQFDEAANQIMDGILDPVIERGSIYTPADR